MQCPSCDEQITSLLQEIKSCQICKDHLPLGPNPVVTISERSPILIIGQAPGLAVHKSGLPWNDKSGDNLRDWLGIEKEQFYNPSIFSIVPVGFCYPGKGKSGDLPPRRECSIHWHPLILQKVKPKLILLAGLYAQQLFLGNLVKSSLTETVRNYQDYLPKFFPLPHPSPRNNIWQKRNSWFKNSVLPSLKKEINRSLPTFKSM